MTKECAIDLYKAIDIYLCAGNPIWDVEKIHDAMSMAIEALQAQTTLDDVSNAYENGYQQGKFEATQKTGKWIHREDMDFIDQNKVQHIHLMCENCGLIHDFFDGHTGQYKFCPSCGTRMECEEE